MEEKATVVEASHGSMLSFAPEVIVQKALALPFGSGYTPVVLNSDQRALFFPFSDLCILYSASIDRETIDHILTTTLKRLTSLQAPQILIFNDYSQAFSENINDTIQSYGKSKHLCRFIPFLIDTSMIVQNARNHGCTYSEQHCFKALSAYISNLNIETSLTFTTSNQTILYCIFHKKPHLEKLITNPLLLQFSNLFGIDKKALIPYPSRSIDDKDCISDIQLKISE